jgi:hypothetical protein
LTKTATFYKVKARKEALVNQELLKKRVELGAEKLGNWFDSRWFLKVDPTRLNMASAERDILGQLYKGYLTGLDWLKIPTNEAHLFGFGIEDCSPDREEAADLTLAWTEKISLEVRAEATTKQIARAAKQRLCRQKKKAQSAVHLL